MRRWETLAALAAVVLASIGSIRSVPGHLLLTIVAVVLIVTVGIARLTDALGRKPEPSSFDPAERARAIRERRDRDRSR